MPYREANKKPGVFYAITDEDVELPIIDVTHPEFAVHVDDAELSRLVDDFSRGIRRRRWIPSSRGRCTAA